jgi:hypothetical protein
LNKNPYEIFKGRMPNVSHIHVFVCKWFVLNNEEEDFDKFDAKTNEGIYLGYSSFVKPGYEIRYG